ncbi:hypothetical protein C0J52_20865 [Blattella germanica]|nr:hypothetical protein C0J52_20865 [Blattella germanica]
MMLKTIVQLLYGVFQHFNTVKRNVTIRSQQKVMYCRGGCFSNVLGVFRLTDNKLNKAQNLMSRRTHSWKHAKVKCYKTET